VRSGLTGSAVGSRGAARRDVELPGLDLSGVLGNQRRDITGNRAAQRSSHHAAVVQIELRVTERSAGILVLLGLLDDRIHGHVHALLGAGDDAVWMDIALVRVNTNTIDAIGFGGVECADATAT